MGSQCKYSPLGPFLKHSQAFVLSLEGKRWLITLFEDSRNLLHSCLQGCCSKGKTCIWHVCICAYVTKEKHNQFSHWFWLFSFLQTILSGYLSQRNSPEYISLNRKRHFHQHQQPPLEKTCFMLFLISPLLHIHVCFLAKLNHLVIHSHFEFKRLSYYCSDELYSTF